MNTIAGASRRRAVIASAWKTCSRVYPRLGRKVSRFYRGRRFDLSKLNRAQLHCAARSYLAELHRSRCLFEKITPSTLHFYILFSPRYKEGSLTRYLKTSISFPFRFANLFTNTNGTN